MLYILLYLKNSKKTKYESFKIVKPMGKITVKTTAQVSGHSLKLHFCMFEKSQGKHNSLDCHNFFWIVFH
jgi:hypothetical protein